MSAVVFGLLAALAGGIGVAALGEASRRLGPVMTASWTGVFGIVLGPAVALALHGSPGGPGKGWLWAFTAGAASLIGNGLLLFATRRGSIALIAPIVASAGGVAGLLAVLLGAPLTPTLALGGLVLTVGVVVAARRPPTSDHSVRGAPTRPTSPQVLLASASAVALAVSYILISKTQESIGSTWAYVALMLEVLCVWTLPQALSGELLRVHRRDLKLVLLGEVAGIGVFLSYGAAAAANRAVASVIYGQYAIVAVVIAVVVFGERLNQQQRVGAGLALLGTLILSLGRL